MFTATVSFILTLDSIYSENALSFNRNANITKLANYQEDINTSSCQLSNAEFVFFQIYNLRPVPFFFFFKRVSGDCERANLLVAITTQIRA